MSAESLLKGNVTAARGTGFTLILRRDGTVWGNGENHWGQLGANTPDQYDIAPPIPGLRDVVAISASVASGVALKRDGTVWQWGYDGRFAFAPNTYLTFDFNVFRWGYDGLHGHGKTPPAALFQPQLRQVIGPSDIVKIAAGSKHFLALRRDGTVWGWGRNDDSQLARPYVSSCGTSSYADCSLPWSPLPNFYAQPVRIDGLDRVTDIVAFADYSLALRDDGTVWGWGTHYHGELGEAPVSQRQDSRRFAFAPPTPEHSIAEHPRPLRGIANVRRIFTAGGVTALIQNDDALWLVGNKCNLCSQYKIDELLTLTQPKRWPEPYQDAYGNREFEAAEALLVTEKTPTAKSDEKVMRGFWWFLDNVDGFRDQNKTYGYKNYIYRLKDYSHEGDWLYTRKHNLFRKMLPVAQTAFARNSNSSAIHRETVPLTAVRLGCRHWYMTRDLLASGWSLAGVELFRNDMPSYPCVRRDEPTEFHIGQQRKPFPNGYISTVVEQLNDQQLRDLLAPDSNRHQSTDSRHHFYPRLAALSWEALYNLAQRQIDKQDRVQHHTAQLRELLDSLVDMKRTDPRLAAFDPGSFTLARFNPNVTRSRLQQLLKVDHLGQAPPISTTAEGLRLQHNAVVGMVKALIAAGADVDAISRQDSAQGEPCQSSIVTLLEQFNRQRYDLGIRARRTHEYALREISQHYILNEDLVLRLIRVLHTAGARLDVRSVPNLACVNPLGAARDDGGNPGSFVDTLRALGVKSQ